MKNTEQAYRSGVMKTLESKSELSEIISQIKCSGKKIGLVPTMGFMHEGHLTLIRESKKKADITVVSIFVNPAQFNEKKDFLNYPKSLIADSEACKKEGADFLFLPTPEEIYPNGIPDLEMKIPHLMKNLCALTRPGHFEGVLLVISNLFHTVQPDIAFFGKKDYQQYLIIKAFVGFCGFKTDVVGLNTIRETDGLAMSSRNARLTKKEREAASLIPRAFRIAKDQVSKGERVPGVIREIMNDIILSSALTKIDYIEILDSQDLSEIEFMRGNILVAIAVHVGDIRLIDNMIFTIPD